MKAELETINGKPILRLTRSSGHGWSSGGKRNTLDLELTPEQARAIKVGDMA